MATRKKRTKKRGARKKATSKKSTSRKRISRKKKALDLSGLSYDQLQGVADEAARRADKLREQRLADLREKWVLEAEDLGFTFDEVAGKRRRRRKKAAKKGKAAGARKTKKTRGRRGKAKYANPADRSQTWSGRGRRPNWLQAYLRKGGDLEALRA